MPSTTAAVPHELRPKKDRACDACRRRKTKCDGSSMSDNVCTNCIQSRKLCTYVETSKPRGPPKAYITGLEDRLEALEALLQQIRPGQDFSDELGPPVVRGSWKSQDGSIDPSSSTIRRKSVVANNILPPLLVPYRSKKDEPSQTSDIFRSPRSTHLIFRSKPLSKRIRMRVDLDATASSYSEESSDETSSSSEQAEETVISSLTGREKITLLVSENDNSTEGDNIRFHGRSSTAGLIEITRQFKHMHMKDTTDPPQEEKEQPASSFPSNLTVAQWRRPTFWRRPKWEYSYENHRAESLEKLQSLLEYFPPPDLADTLIGLYFQHSNLTLPLLHRPTFNRQWKEQLHHRNIWFAGVCLSIFAIGSRWSNDKRVLPELITQENENTDSNWRHAGRQYFDMVAEIHRIRESILHPTSLFEVQTFTLMGLYLRSTTAFPSAWIIISTGLRKTQDLGAHRKKVYRDEPNLDDELWKRAFWMLVFLDRIGGMSLGRSCGISEEDFDLDLPLEVDDEYYDQEAKQFKQPTGVPSTLTAFVQMLKLTQIMAFTMKTLYAINKTNIYHGVAPMDQKLITKQLSLAMSEWLERLPGHLRWQEKMDNSLFLGQSAMLFTLYHLTQMLIWRPLIASHSRQTESNLAQTNVSIPSDPTHSIPALTDPASVRCIDAARACARIVEVQLRHGVNSFYIPLIIYASHICGGLLVLNAWHLKVQEKELRRRGTLDTKPPVANRIEQDITEAKIFIRALKEVQYRWDLVDMLLEELNESLIGLDNPHAEYEPHELKKSRSITSIPNPQLPTEIQHHQKQLVQATSYSSSSTSKEFYPTSSATPIHYGHPATTRGTFSDSDPIRADVSQNTPTVPYNDRSLPSVSKNISWHERLVPYISTIGRTSLSANTTPLDLQDERFATEEIRDIASYKPPLQVHDAPARTDDTNTHSDNRVYLSTPRHLHEGYHQDSPSMPFRASYERGHDPRTDGWANTIVRNAGSDRPIPAEDDWRVPSSGPSRTRASEPLPNEDEYSHGYAPRSL